MPCLFFQRHWKVIKDNDSSYRPKMESLWDTHHICDPLQVSSQETNGNNITYLINIINETMTITSVPMCSPNILLPSGYWGKLFFQPFAAGWDHMMSSGQENVYRSGMSVPRSPHTPLSSCCLSTMTTLKMAASQNSRSWILESLCEGKSPDQ